MKKIAKQLIKLFGNNIQVRHVINSFSGDIKEEYTVYIANATFYRYSWSPEFNTLKELDKHLSEKIPNYKRVYND